MNLAFRAALVWLGLFVIAFVNGALREFGMKLGLGISEPLAHQLSCLTGLILWTGFTLRCWKYLDMRRLRQSVWVGSSWFFATWLFETFVLNRGMSWPEILHTYDFLSGEYWGLVLLSLGLMPVVIFWFKATSERIET